MHVLLRQLGQHRGSPRLYLDCAALAAAGFLPGTPFEIVPHTGDEPRVSIRATACGRRKVSRKSRGPNEVPVIDINGQADLQPFVAVGAVRIIITMRVMHIVLPAGARKALERSSRLASRMAMHLPLRAAGIAFGAGIASGALHAGLQSAGVPTSLAVANEISEAYLELGRRANPVVGADSCTAAVPMQELAADDWLLDRIGPVEILEAGIPCSGASRAGMAKRRLARMEDHPQVGHLLGAALQVIAALQPTIVLVENVETYSGTASASILRGWLRDAGYAMAEAVLNARDFGSLEERIRWFLVAFPPELGLSLEGLAPGDPGKTELGPLLDPIGPEDERFREVEYLKRKEERDASKGSHFGMQYLTPQSTRVPVLRKGYHKGGSPDPRLLHPTDATRSRLLTAAEHARIKGVDPALIRSASETTAHQVCGQSVDVRPVQAIGRRIGAALRAGSMSTKVPAQVWREFAVVG